MNKNVEDNYPGVWIELKEDFQVIEDGCTYALPTYNVEDGKGIVRSERVQMIHFVRGSKLNDEDVERKEGTLHEHLLSMMIHDLKFKNELVPSREGSLTITKMEEVLDLLRRRQIDRVKRNVAGTYKK